MGTFRDKYFGIPGDFTKASDFGWGALNGDGDGLIENTAAAGTNEISTFWIHLASAGLIEGSYTNAGTTTQTGGTHNPLSKVSSASWHVGQLGTVTIAGVSSPWPGATAPATTTFFTGSYGNVLMLGGGTNALLPTGVLKAEEAWNIDTKLDDGKPDIGSLRTLESQGENDLTRCSNLDGALTAIAASDYALTSTSSTACALVFNTNY